MTSIAYEIPNLSLVRVAGTDCIKVLNGLCTAKLVDLKAGGATEVMFTDDRGRVLVHGMIALEPEQAAAWIVGLYPTANQLVAHIDRFIFREAAEPKDVSRDWRAWLIDAGSKPEEWTQLADQLSVPPGTDCTAVTIEGQPGWLMRFPVSSPHARLLLVPTTADADAITTRLTSLGIALGSSDDLEDRRIRNFWPLAASEMTERTLPQELDRDQLAISFTKGCYLGQETVARLDALGEVQKKLCLVELHGSSEMVAGQSLSRDNKEVGKLNSVSPIVHAGKRYALATMRRGSTAVGSQFVVDAVGDQPCSGVVIAHP